MRHEPIHQKLSTGMQVLLQPDLQLPLVALQLGYRGGSRVEDREKAGLAHLCEHLALRGPEAAVDYFETVERVGGTVNGATFYDRTVFEQSLPAGQLGLGLSVEARRMRNPAEARLDRVERQRQVLVREHHQRRSNQPQAESVEWIQRLLYPKDHPYSSPPAGTIEGIRAIEPSDVEAHFSTCYSPDRAVLSIVGNFDLDEALVEVENLFEGIGPSPRAVSIQSPLFPAPFDGPQRHEIRVKDPTLRIYKAFRGPGLGEPGWEAATLWVRSVCLGRSSPLQKSLIEETGLAQQVKGGMVHMRDASTVILEAVAAPDVPQERLETAFAECLDRIVEEEVDGDVLRRVCRRAANDHYHEMQRLERRADHLATRLTFFGERSGLASLVEVLESLSASDLNRFGREHCSAARRLTLAALPEREGRAG